MKKNIKFKAPYPTGWHERRARLYARNWFQKNESQYARLYGKPRRTEEEIYQEQLEVLKAWRCEQVYDRWINRVSIRFRLPQNWGRNVK